MTEEFKQKAEEYSHKKWTPYKFYDSECDVYNDDIREDIQQAYIAGATEETKELEKERLRIIGVCSDREEGLRRKIADLEDQITKWREDYICLENLKDYEIKELQEQIEKMKCCGNCKHFDFNEPNYCHKGVYRERQYVCDEWELSE